MSNTNSRPYLAAAIIAVVVLVYAYATWSNRPVGTYRFGVPFSRFTGAEQLRTARSPELIEEIKILIEQNGLPVDVFLGLSGTSSKATPEERARFESWQQHNIAPRLHELFGRFYIPKPNPDDENILLDVPLNDEMQRLWEASPIGPWYIDWESNPVGILPIDVEKLNSVRPILISLETTRREIRDRLFQQRTIFYYVFERLADSAAYTGTVVNSSASRYLADYALLEEYAVALALLEGDIDEAIDCLNYIFRIAYLASRLEDIGARSDSVIVRLRAYDVMQRVILDPKFERQHMLVLRTIISEQYQNWTPEYNAWFGDRAAGLMLYRRLMMQGAQDVLNQNDINDLERRGLRTSFNRHFRQNHELDTTFYLQSMRKILEISTKNYADRTDVLNQIYRELEIRKDSYDESGTLREPIVASLLLRDVDQLMYLFAQDQSALTRVMVAVLHSLGQRSTEGYRNPFTKEPYRVRQVDGFLSIEVEELPRPFRVPILIATE